MTIQQHIDNFFNETLKEEKRKEKRLLRLKEKEKVNAKMDK